MVVSVFGTYCTFFSILEHCAPPQIFYIHEKLMRPRIFIFCSYLHKKLCDDVLAPSDPFSDPLRPSAGPNRGPKIVDIRENSMLQAVIPRGTDRRSACFLPICI